MESGIVYVNSARKASGHLAEHHKKDLTEGADCGNEGKQIGKLGDSGANDECK